ncbi:hypothetical protein V6615_03375 [Oscillospiraceae bacterium PP1C4]
MDSNQQIKGAANGWYDAAGVTAPKLPEDKLTETPGKPGRDHKGEYIVYAVWAGLKMPSVQPITHIHWRMQKTSTCPEKCKSPPD